jgi:hypothetical protein
MKTKFTTVIGLISFFPSMNHELDEWAVRWKIETLWSELKALGFDVKEALTSLAADDLKSLVPSCRPGDLAKWPHAIETLRAPTPPGVSTSSGHGVPPACRQSSRHSTTKNVVVSRAAHHTTPQ